MKKLFLLTFGLMFAFPLWGYEFKTSSLTTPIGKTIPKQVLVRKQPAAVIFLKTKISNLEDKSDSTVQQEKASGEYVLYIAPDWPAHIFLTAPGFKPKDVEIGSLPPNSVREMEVSSTGKDPKSFNLASATLSFESDFSNATAAVSQSHAPEIWIYTDLSFKQVRDLLNEGGYTEISNDTSPYRISPRKKKAKAADVLSPAALNKLGNISKMPLEARTVYNLDIRW